MRSHSGDARIGDRNRRTDEVRQKRSDLGQKPHHRGHAFAVGGRGRPRRSGQGVGQSRRVVFG